MKNTANDHVLTGAPVRLTLSGQEYRLSPLSDRDMVELDDYCRSEYLARASRACQSLGYQDREDYRRVAMTEAMGLSWKSSAGQAILRDRAGYSRLIWQGLVGNHPALTHREVEQAFRQDPEAISVSQDAFRRANGGQDQQNPTNRPTDQPTDGQT